MMDVNLKLFWRTATRRAQSPLVIKCSKSLSSFGWSVTAQQMLNFSNNTYCWTPQIDSNRENENIYSFSTWIHLLVVASSNISTLSSISHWSNVVLIRIAAPNLYISREMFCHFESAYEVSSAEVSNFLVHLVSAGNRQFPTCDSTTFDQKHEMAPFCRQRCLGLNSEKKRSTLRNIFAIRRPTV